jgi:hypothetical protein
MNRVEIERFVPPWSKDQTWSKYYQPVGPLPGHSHTHIRYQFDCLNGSALQKGTAIRFVATSWRDTVTLPAETWFLNTIVTVSGFTSNSTVDNSSACAEGFDDDGNFFRWNMSSLEVKDCSIYPELIGEKVVICETGFSLVVNRRLYLPKEIVHNMALYNMDVDARNTCLDKKVEETDAFLYCRDETIVDYGQQDFATNRALAEMSYRGGIAPFVEDILRSTTDCTETMSYILNAHLLNRQAEKNKR